MSITLQITNNYQLHCSYLTWNFDYFAAQGIDGPKPIPLFGNLLSMRKVNI